MLVAKEVTTEGVRNDLDGLFPIEHTPGAMSSRA
jgi:hypothetical protein